MLRTRMLRSCLRRSVARFLATQRSFDTAAAWSRPIHCTRLLSISSSADTASSTSPPADTTTAAPSDSQFSSAPITLSQTIYTQPPPTSIRRRGRRRRSDAVSSNPTSTGAPVKSVAELSQTADALSSEPSATQKTAEPELTASTATREPLAVQTIAFDPSASSSPTAINATASTASQLPKPHLSHAVASSLPSRPATTRSQSASQHQPQHTPSRFSPPSASRPELSQLDTVVSPPPPTTAAYTSLPPHESTYVSTHYHIDMDDVHAYLRRKQLVYRENPDHSQIVIRDCPFCHPINGKQDNQYKLTVYMPAANHYCHRCRAKGSWYDMKKRLGDIRDTVTTLRDQPITPHYTKGFPAFKQTNTDNSNPNNNDITTQTDTPPNTANTAAANTRRHRQPTQSSMAAYHEQLTDYPAVVDWLTGGEDSGGRGLRRDLLDFYKVGAGKFKFISEEGKYVDEECVTFPWMRVKEEKVRRKSSKASDGADDTKMEEVTASEEKKEQDSTAAAESSTAAAASSTDASAASSSSYIIDRIKYRSRVTKSHQRLLPTGGNWGFFGYHTIPASATSVILTEGEFDAIAAYQCTGVPAISLPNGANNLPVELLPFLERFTVIYLWMDDDRVGQEGAETFAKKLGINRCWIVRTRGGQPDGPKDANDALLQGYDLCDILAAAQPLPHRQITTFEELRDDVWKEIADPHQRAGVPSTSLPTLNSTLKGHRRGELTVITGSTGVGKTTVLSQLSLDYCAQGVNTLWGSFEIKNFKLAKTMLSQYSGIDFTCNADQFNHYADQFEQLPMYFMRFFGSSSVDQVLDAMDYAVYMHDVQHVVLDNLQFMLAGQSDKADKFDLQDRAINEFRHFATHKNVHITLVIHPRKEADMRPLGVSSVFGSAKATQEADNVIILQAPTPPTVFTNGSYGGDASGWMGQKAVAAGGEMDKYRRLQIMKNRYDGEVGVIPFLYDRATGRIQEVDKDGNVKHRAVFARVVPAPPSLATVEGGEKAVKRRGRKPSAGSGSDGGGESEGGAEQDDSSAFKPAPLFVSSVAPTAAPSVSIAQPHMQPAGLPSPGPFHPSPVQVVDSEDDVRMTAVSPAESQQQQSVSGIRRYQRDGDASRSTPTFDLIA